MRSALVLALALAACAGPATVEKEPAPRVAALPKDRLALPQVDLARYHAILEELRGTPVVVNIWGAWCPPCRAEAPALAKVSRAHEGRVQFLGVDILDERQAARDFILEFDWPYPSIFDPNAAIRDGLGYLGQPVTIVYDRDGEITFEHTGAISEEMLEAEIEKVL
ncbi:MAG TPA: TlpA disulfide reductase family protein [Actinomycetota bacterium]|nr:TlpA disulfide reductase family protein [Actinomycetota bacterium]